MLLPDDKLRGRPVVAADGQVIGELAAMVIDCDVWRVTALQVRLNKEVADEVGAGRNVFRAGELEIPVRLLQSTGDAVVLLVPVARLHGLVPGDKPATTPRT